MGSSLWTVDRRWAEPCRVLGWSREGALKGSWLRFRVSPPTLGSIVSRSRAASRRCIELVEMTGCARRLRRSPPAILDPAPDRERFRLYRVGGESVAQRIQFGAGLGAVAGRARTARCLTGAYDSGRDLVNRSQASRRSGRVGFRAGRITISPLIRRVPHGRGASPPSGAWGTSAVVGKCPRLQGSSQCGVGRAGRNARWALGRTASAKVETGRPRCRQAWRAGHGEVIPNPPT